MFLALVLIISTQMVSNSSSVTLRSVRFVGIERSANLEGWECSVKPSRSTFILKPVLKFFPISCNLKVIGNYTLVVCDV